MAVAWDATGAGNSNATGAALSATHTIAVSSPSTYVLVGVEISVSSNSTSTTCTATYGGTPMTLLSGALTLLGSSTSRSAVGIFYLANPPAGAQTITVTPGGTSTKTRAAFGSVSYTQVTSIGAQQSAASLTLSATSVAGGYDFAVSVNGATISAPTQTQRYLNSASVGGVGDSILIQDAIGTGSNISFSSSGTATTPATLVVALSPVVNAKVATLVDTFDGGLTSPWGATGGVTADSGGIRVSHSASAADYQFFNTNATGTYFDLLSSAAFVEIRDYGNQALASHQIHFTLGSHDDQDLVEFWGLNGSLYAFYRSGGGSLTQPAGSPITLDTSAHRWLRLREASGTIFWDTSPDRISWTNRFSITTATLARQPSSVYPQLFCGEDTADGASSALFDNFNVPPSSLTPPIHRPNYGALLQL